MEIKKIKEIIKLLENTDITEFELSENENSVKISKSNPKAEFVAVSSQPIAKNFNAPNPISSPPSVVEEQQNNTSKLGKTINAPMVGTFYSSPSPDANTFVSIGQEVKEGEVICIIEAMKMFNKIEADIKGTIKKVLVNDGDPIEFDQPLFEIE